MSDLLGKRFGKLVVVCSGIMDKGKQYASCDCDCGKSGIFRVDHLRRGESQSCGCEGLAALRKGWESRTKHGECSRVNGKTAEWKVWNKMIARCRDSNDKAFPRYGGRGIKVCDRWLEYLNFISDMGRRPTAGHSIERKDNDGNYEPGNCRWATKQEQANNRRTNRLITANGITATLADWQRKTGIHQLTIRARLVRGWSEQRAVTEALQ